MPRYSHNIGDDRLRRSGRRTCAGHIPAPSQKMRSNWPSILARGRSGWAHPSSATHQHAMSAPGFVGQVRSGREGVWGFERRVGVGT
eukprot:2077490-Rhodomonas_salina.1